MRMEWKWCFRRKRAVLAALGAVLIIAILFNIASEMHSRHVQVSARLLKWVDFNVTAAAMRDALQYDIESHGTDNEIHWIDLLACLGARYGGDFSHYKKAHMDSLASQLKDGKSMDELTRDAIRQALRVGKEVIFCTGRPVAETRQYLKLFPDMRYLLCESGALLYDLHKKTPVYRKCLADETVQALAQTAAGRDICPVAFIEGEYYIASHMKENGLRADKINLFHTTPEDRAISRKILEEMGVPICMADGEISSLECTAPGVSKGLGLEKLSQETGISTADMIVVGDADNDLVGLAAAGLAVAMGNASDRVKNVCDVVVADNEHCGCAEAICRYLLGTY